LADTFAAFLQYIEKGGTLPDLLSHVNHPNYEGHKLIARTLAGWFLARSGMDFSGPVTVY
jgi:hypothetical protein